MSEARYFDPEWWRSIGPAGPAVYEALVRASCQTLDAWLKAAVEDAGHTAMSRVQAERDMLCAERDVLLGGPDRVGLVDGQIVQIQAAHERHIQFVVGARTEVRTRLAKIRQAFVEAAQAGSTEAPKEAS